MSAARLPGAALIFSCPQCDTAVRAGDTIYRSWAINLALAAALAEGCTRASLPHFEPGTSRPIAELPRFGEFLVSQVYMLVMNRTIVRLPDLVEPLRDYLQSRVDMAQVAVARDAPASLPLTQADAESIYWVLAQRLDNAVKFNPPGGRATQPALAGAATMRPSVRDASLSLSTERLRLIFEPFAQAADAPGQAADGAGLGLVLVKRIVQAHDSRIEVDSRVGQGSPFSCEPPLARLAFE